MENGLCLSMRINSRDEDPNFFFLGSGSAEEKKSDPIGNEQKIFIYFIEKKYLYYSNSSPPIRIFLNGNVSSVNRHSLKLLILVYILFKMKIILYIRCYRQDPDPQKKVTDQDPAAQKSTDPTGSGSSFLINSDTVQVKNQR